MFGKVILGTVLGFTLGISVGYIISKKKLEDEYEEAYHQEINDYHDMLDKKYERLNKESKIKEEKAEVNSITNFKPDSSDIVAYHKIVGYDDEESDCDESDFDMNEAMNEKMIKVERREPYLISYDQYCDEKDWYEKLDVYFYVWDGVLCDEVDDVIEHAHYHIIPDNILRERDNETKIFVRNEIFQTDYEIIFIEASYKNSVADLIETPSEKEERHANRKNA